MITTNKPKDKRGKHFKHATTGQELWLYTIKSSEVYICCTSPGFLNTDDYLPFKMSELTEVSKGFNKPIASKPINAAKKAHKDDLNEFFDKVALTMPYNCECCHKPLYAFTKFAKRSVTAHIIPKGQFKSVATNPDNVMFLGCSLLGVCHCHSTWDEKGSLERAKMPVYELALERFEKFKGELTAHELVRAYSYLNIEFDNRPDMYELQQQDIENIAEFGVSNNK